MMEMGVSVQLEIKIDTKGEIEEIFKEFINCFNEFWLGDASIHYDLNILERFERHLSVEDIVSIMRGYKNKDWTSICIYACFFHLPSIDADNGCISGILTISNEDYPAFSWSTTTSAGLDALIYKMHKRNFFPHWKKWLRIWIQNLL